MYSVEDLLISHGYKLSRNCPAPPTAAASSSSAPLENKQRHGNPRRDNVDIRPGGGGALNGFGTEGGAEGRAEAQGGGAIQRAEGGENVERLQRRKEVPVGYLGDLQPLGDSLATDSGFYDAPSLTYSEHPEERDVSYWRRRGQDFSALLDYADPRELRLSGGLWRGVGFAPEELRADRPVARWEEPPSWQQQREPVDSGPETLRVQEVRPGADRKCQSLGTEEWRPAVGLGRQLSDGEAERWAQQEQQLRLRPHEGAIVPVVRQKSQSLPRVLTPEDPQYADPPSTGPPALPVGPRLNGSALYGRYPGDWASSGERWAGQGQFQGQSQSQGQIQSQSHIQGHGSTVVVPKPRFSRPVKPPSYETHQQNRGSWETLTPDPVPKQRDRPLAHPQSTEPLRERSLCLSQGSEPLRDRSLCISQGSEPLRDRSLCISQSSEPFRDRSLCISQSSELIRDRSLCISQGSEPLRDRSLCISQGSEPLRDRSFCISQSSELLRDRSLCISQGSELLRDRSLCFSQSSEPFRDRSLCISQSSDPFRDRSLCLSQSSEPLRDRSLCLSQSSEPLRDRSLCLSQSSEPFRDRPLCLSQSAEPLRDLRDRPLCLSQSAEPLRDLRDRPLCLSQSAEPLREIRDRSLCFSQSAEILRMDVRPDLLPHDLYGSGVEPPGYIPPPSYRRMPPHRGLISYRADAAHLRWKREPVSAEMGRWFSRQPAITWMERWDDRSSMAVARKPLHPGPPPAPPSRPGGVVQYLPFDDLRIRHISGGTSVAAVPLQDAEKMRQQHASGKDLLPTPAASGQSTHDSAFITAQGPSLSTDASSSSASAHKPPAPSDQDNSATHWPPRGAVTKPNSEAVAAASDHQSVAKFYAAFPARPPPALPPARLDRPPEPPKRPDKLPELPPPRRPDRPPELPKRPTERPAAEQPKQTDTSADQQSKAPKAPPDPKGQGSSESLSHMKKPDLPPPEPPLPPPPEKPKSMKRKLNETIFCLVSVPTMLSQQSSGGGGGGDTSASASSQRGDQNNNNKEEKKKMAAAAESSSSPVRIPPPPPSTPSEKSNTLSSGPNQSLKSTSTTSTDLELQALMTLGSISVSSSSRVSSRRGPAHHHRSRRDSRPIKPNPHDALRRYSGAWPGDFYRDQETQTSPEPAKSAPATATAAAASGPPNTTTTTTEAQQHTAAPPAPGGGTPATPAAAASAPAPADGPAAPEAGAGAGAEGGSGASFGYPMKGQKRLKPSSNSAFSRTGTFCKSTGSGHKAPLHPPSHPPPPPPNHPPAKTTPSPPPALGEGPKPPGPGPSEAAFGQFLLKPVSRRPGDAIEELESINKEVQEQEQAAGKRPSVDQCIEDLNEAYKDILELSSTASNSLSSIPHGCCSSASSSAMLIPERIKAKLTDQSQQPLPQPQPLKHHGGSLRSGLESWAGAVLGSDPEYREVKSAFSRPSTVQKSVSFSKHLREEICCAGPSSSSMSSMSSIMSETGFRDYRSVVSAISQRRSMDGRTVKLDFPPSKDSPPKDEALNNNAQATAPPSGGAAAAEVPWADRQPMQDASTLTSPPDYEHICQSLQQAPRDPGSTAPPAGGHGPAAAFKPQAAGSSSSGGSGAEGPAGGTVAREECCYCQMEAERLRLEQAAVARDDRGSGITTATGPSGRFPDGCGALSGLAPGKDGVPPDWTIQRDGGGGEVAVPPDWTMQRSGGGVPVPSDWRMQLSLAEKHLETLITGEKKRGGAEAAAAEGEGDPWMVPEAGPDDGGSVEARATQTTLSPDSSAEIPTTAPDPVVQGQRDPAAPDEQNQGGSLRSAEPVPAAPEPGRTARPPEESSSSEGSQNSHTHTHTHTHTPAGGPPPPRSTAAAAEPGRVAMAPEEASSSGEGSQEQARPRREPCPAARGAYPGLDPALLQEFPPERLPLSVPPHHSRRLSLGPDWERRVLEEERWGLGGGGGAGERRSLDAERRGILCGERWGLEDDWRRRGQENVGLEMEGEGPSTEGRGLEDEGRGLEDEGRDSALHKQGAAPPERRGRVPSQRIEALQERLTWSPGRVAKERIARMKEVDSVSRIRRLSLRSTGSWDGEEGPGGGAGGGPEGQEAAESRTPPAPPTSQAEALQNTLTSPTDVTELSHTQDV